MLKLPVSGSLNQSITQDSDHLCIDLVDPSRDDDYETTHCPDALHIQSILRTHLKLGGCMEDREML